MAEPDPAAALEGMFHEVAQKAGEAVRVAVNDHWALAVRNLLAEFQAALDIADDPTMQEEALYEIRQVLARYTTTTEDA